MKNIIKSSIILVLSTIFFMSCEDKEYTLGANEAPTDEQMDFTITPGDDAFHFVITNNTPVDGIHTVNWDLGNGASDKGNEIIAYYPLPGEFEVTLTITTNNGQSNSKIGNVEQTETDYSFLESPILTYLTGGVENTEGKTWVVDSLASGHFGIGPTDGVGLEWWAATPLQKTMSGAYDDEFNFKLVDFVFTYENYGDSYVKDSRISDSNYSNPVEVDGTDARVQYTITESASWTLTERDGINYLILSSGQPMFLGFDYGGTYEYRIDEIDETNISLSTIGGDGNRWYNKLILKGYEKPTVTFTTDIAEAADENTWAVSLQDVEIPEGVSVNGFTVDFGDGSEVYSSDDYNATIEHTYMRKGTYPVTITVRASNEDTEDMQSITIDNYHSEYEVFLLDYMVMYVDNSEVEMAPMQGEDCALTLVENPERIYPNKGVNVLHYSKDGQEWANANMKLPAGYRFNLTKTSVFKVMVRGKAGQAVLLKLENTDRGGNAWQTGAELSYTIQADDTWEVAEYDFAGVGAGWDWTGDIFTSDITTDPNFNDGFYNIVRIMLNPGNGEGAHEFYIDDLAGPHVEGLKSASE
ncbi:PKD domain-containing protein [Saccharicrinis aurantiacus]|uniref:PKD domain-containing protein n=1 Tax=Saccharicrinis aurantiacus TaxID=1849719 RepID=UPI00094F6CDD|nr:PKD domain-containing protein [Saccharicrinis aurantiacus]